MRALNIILLVLFLFSFCESILASDKIYYVTPVDEGGACDVGGAVLEPCLPLTNFTPEMLTSNNDSQYLNITMLFLPGEHLISSQYNLSSSNVDIFRMLSYSEKGIATVSSTCAGAGTLSMTFLNMKVLKIDSMKFLSSIKASNITSLNVRNCTINVHGPGNLDCTFSNDSFLSKGKALQVTSVINLTIENSFFYSNQAYCNGVAVHILDCKNVEINGVNFTNNRAKRSGGAVYASNSSTIKLTNCVFSNSTSGAVTIKTANYLLIGNSSFSSNEAYNGGTLNISNCVNVELNAVNFTNNKAIKNGGAISAHNNSLMSLNNCVFSNNTSQWSAGAFQVTGGENLTIRYSLFLSNYGDFGGALGISYCKNVILNDLRLANNAANDSGGAIYVEGSVLHDSLTNIYIESNSAGVSGGGIMLTGSSTLTVSSGTLYIKNNTAGVSGGGIRLIRSTLALSGGILYIDGNTARSTGGGIKLIYSSSILLSSGTLCIISNRGIYAGGVMLTGSSTLEVSNGLLHISNNTAGIDGGGVLFTGSGRLVLSNGTLNIDGNTAGSIGGGVLLMSISNLKLSNGTLCIKNNAAGISGGGVALTDSATFKLSSGTILYINNNKAEISGGGLKLTYESTFELSSGTLCMDNNTAGNSGGGVALDDGSYLKLSNGSDIYFSNNSVTAEDGKGGAIFVSNNCFSNNSCPIHVQPNNSGKRYLHFSGNHAANGSILYGGLDKCWGKNNSVLSLIESEPVLDPDNLTYAITSNVTLCFCENNKPNCRVREIDISRRYPGQTFILSMIPLNELDEPVSSTIESHYSDSDQLNFRTNEKSQNIPAKCQDVKFHVYSTENFMSVIELVIGTNNDNQCDDLKRLTINFAIEPCPLGFELSDGRCVCDKRLLGFLEVCDIEQQTGNKSESNGWFEYDKKYLKINYYYCPLNYCIRNKSNTISFLHSLCADNREGVLCGACADNYSIGLGSWRCLPCTYSSRYNFIWLVPLIATAGVILVALLLLLKLTVSSGTINGLVFYANVISVSQLTNLPDCLIHPVLSVFISWVNLDFGIETCFYSGMDTYQKTWLQFAFPLYIWFLVAIIIIVCQYSSRAMKLMGKRSIDILATLFLLSYAKLLKTVITALNFVDIMIAKADNVSDPLVPHKVWTYDGNVDYLTGKHLPLFVVALFFLVFLFLPYTLLLTFGQCLRSLPRKRGLRWVRSTAFISIMDAYHAPYNRRHRYWTGLTLLTRCVLFTVFAVNTHNILTTNMFTTVIIISLLLVIRLLVTNTLYQNYLIDKLDLSFLLNLGFLAATLQYLGSVGKHAHCQVTTVSIIFAFITFLGIAFYHLYLQVKGTTSYKDIITKLNSCGHFQTSMAAAVVADTDTSANNSHSTSFIQLRESLLASTFD